jgi:hypothetical protein
LNRLNRILIVPAMRKTVLALVLASLAALPALAQASEFGFLVGGSNRIVSAADQAGPDGLPDNNWRFSDSVKEIYFSVQLDPGTRFRIKAGDINGTVTFLNPDESRTHFEGHVEHLDALVDYRFSEPFGTTGIFLGPGLYRQKGGGLDETSYGFSGGVNADLPLSRRYGVVLEATYHWAHFDATTRYLTAAGGLRISF